MQPPQPAAETRQVKKSFVTGEVTVEAVRGVTVAIHPGELTAIVGPSGCGKSSLLSMLGAIDTPTSGQVFVGGVDVATLSDYDRTLLRRRQIGFVFQAFNLMPTLSALENAALPLELDGVSQREAHERAAPASSKSASANASTISPACSPAANSSASPSPARW